LLVRLDVRQLDETKLQAIAATGATITESAPQWNSATVSATLTQIARRLSKTFPFISQLFLASRPRVHAPRREAVQNAFANRGMGSRQIGQLPT